MGKAYLLCVGERKLGFLPLQKARPPRLWQQLACPPSPYFDGRGPREKDGDFTCQPRASADPLYDGGQGRRNCAKLPPKVHYRLHPKHPLTLHFDSSETFECSVCNKTGSGFAFLCGKCLFIMDVTCFLRNQPYLDVPPLEGKTRKLQHFSHDHTLTLCYITQQSEGTVKDVNSKFRVQLIAAKNAMSWHSTNPVLNGHGRQNILSTLRTPSHSLQNRLIPGKHGVMPVGRPSVVLCTTATNVRSTLTCCKFNVHSTCVPFPITVEHRHHSHSLTLEDSIPGEDSSGICCASCEKKISPKALAYYCAECCYGVHPECVVPEEQPDRAPTRRGKGPKKIGAIAAQLSRDKEAGLMKIRA
ncbi:hypothetical protein BT93_D1560 [Corymbia citriodora subsp. variegata]|nr:hypothetical protein BT93_D1560 [Corymbia citriodora subsp. variegata]